TCATCGANSEDMCEFVYDSNTVCPEPYCINVLRNPDTGQRLLMRKCGTLNECKRDWWDKTSDRVVCTSFNGNFIYTDAFECTYCCTTPNCNEDIHPAANTLYKE
ncbi:hypothetical protein ACJMK2_015731, partial [Sinanodonta woodiana]